MKAVILNIARITVHMTCVIALLAVSFRTPNPVRVTNGVNPDPIACVDCCSDTDSDDTNKNPNTNTVNQTLAEEHDESSHTWISLKDRQVVSLNDHVETDLLAFHSSDLPLFSPPPEV